MPSPFGEGQTDTLINHLNQGEVLTPRIEKTVFISYRRTNLPWGLAIYQNLTVRGYDVFFDYESINSGDFEQMILGNIKARAHFLVLLTPSALERCDNVDDWLRREIETALDEKRNIVPLFLEGFDFSSPSIAKHLTGKLTTLHKYNGLEVPSSYFFESMERLHQRYLNIPLDKVLHPLSTVVIKAVQDQQTAANKAIQVEQRELTAQEWYEQGKKLLGENRLEDSISAFEKATELDPSLEDAWENKADVYIKLGRKKEASETISKLIELL